MPGIVERLLLWERSAILGFQLVGHARVIFTRQTRLQFHIAFNDEALHGVIIEQVFIHVVHFFFS